MQDIEYESYDTILQKLHKCIVDNNGNNDNLVFQAPQFVYGNTSYNLKKCLAFIIKKMRDEKKTITYKSPNFLVLKNMKRIALPPDKPKASKTEKAPKGFKFYYADEDPRWNDVEITCRGLQFTFVLNGVVMSDFDGTGYLDVEGRKDYHVTAPIMFQAHGKDGVTIRYKDIRIKKLK